MRKKRTINDISKDLDNTNVKKYEDKYQKANVLINEYKYSISDAAKAIGVCRSTLSRRIKRGFSNIPTLPTGTIKYLYSKDVDHVYNYVKENFQRQNCLTRTELLSFINEYIKEKRLSNEDEARLMPKGYPGYSWLNGFLKRNVDKFDVYSVLEMDKCGVTDVIINEIQNFFSTIQQIENKYNIKSGLRFNIDEHVIKDQYSGKTVDVIIPVGADNPIRIFDKDRLSLLCLINEMGDRCKPYALIDHSILDQMTEDQKSIVMESVLFPSSDNIHIMMTRDLFRTYITDVLIPYVEEYRTSHNYDRSDIALLYTANQSSRFDETALSLLNKHYIICISIPPHTSQVFQPLGIRCFGQYNIKLKKQASSFIYSNSNPVVLKLLKTVDIITKHFTIDKIINAWAISRLYPINEPSQNEIIDKFSLSYKLVPDEDQITHRKKRHAVHTIINSLKSIEYYSRYHNTSKEIENYLLSQCNIRI